MRFVNIIGFIGNTSGSDDVEAGAAQSLSLLLSSGAAYNIETGSV